MNLIYLMSFKFNFGFGVIFGEVKVNFRTNKDNTSILVDRWELRGQEKENAPRLWLERPFRKRQVQVCTKLCIFPILLLPGCVMLVRCFRTPLILGASLAKFKDGGEKNGRERESRRGQLGFSRKSY